MTPSNKRSLVFIIIFLVLTNIAVLAYFLMYNKENHNEGGDKRGKNGIADALQKDVGFNEQQLAQYHQLKDEQWKVFRPMLDEVHNAKDSLFRLLGNEQTNDSIINTLGSRIGEKQKKVDLQAFNHFKKVRAICTPEQLVKYDSLILRLMKKMGKPRGDQKKDKDKH